MAQNQSLSEQYRENLKASLKTGASRYAQVKAEARNADCSLLGADPELLRATLAAVIEDGAAVLLSLTSDTGALCIRILEGTTKPAWYSANEDELNENLRQIGKAAINP